MKKPLKWIGIALAVLIGILAIAPFLIPVRPLDGLVPIAELAGPDDRFITLPFDGTDGIDIRYVEAGDDTGRSFVMLHGSVFNAATWDQVTDALTPFGKVYAYDQIPYGLSEKLTPADWTGETPYGEAAATDRLIALLDAWDIERAVLVANSYGAVLAVRTAAAYPERVEALVLSDAAVYVNENLPAWMVGLPQVQRLGPLLARGIGGSQTFLNATWAAPEKMSDGRRAKTLIHTRAENWDKALWAYLANWRMSDLSDAIAAIRQPVLVVSGAQDSVVPLADSERLATAIPGARLEVLPDCGHVPQEECPGAFSEAVTGWLVDLD